MKEQKREREKSQDNGLGGFSFGSICAMMTLSLELEITIMTKLIIMPKHGGYWNVYVNQC